MFHTPQYSTLQFQIHLELTYTETISWYRCKVVWEDLQISVDTRLRWDWQLLTLLIVEHRIVDTTAVYQTDSLTAALSIWHVCVWYLSLRAEYTSLYSTVHVVRALFQTLHTSLTSLTLFIDCFFLVFGLHWQIPITDRLDDTTGSWSKTVWQKNLADICWYKVVGVARTGSTTFNLSYWMLWNVWGWQ